MQTNDNPDKPASDHRWGPDYSYGQHLFLRSIEKQMPRVLDDLREQVLPPFIAARQRIPEAHRTFCDQAPTIGDDITVWSALWDWAQQYHLIESKDIAALKSWDPLCVIDLAHLHGLRHVGRPVPDVSPFTLDSSALVFGLTTLVSVVKWTLKKWSEDPGRSDRKWTFPPDSSALDDKDNERRDDFLLKMAGVRSWEELELVLSRQALATLNNTGLKMNMLLRPPPYYYEFTPVRAWDIGHESRAKAQARILKAVKEQLRQLMDEQELIAERCGFEKRSRSNDDDKFDLLVAYKVEGLANYSQIAKRIYEHRHGRTDKKKESDADRGKREIRLHAIENQVTQAINRAAQLVIGPQWKSWLQDDEAGRAETSPS